MARPTSPLLQNLLSSSHGHPESPFLPSLILPKVGHPFSPCNQSPRSSMFHRQLSPLRPYDSPTMDQCIQRQSSEALWNDSRERDVVGSTKKVVDLRKKIALKVHKDKQVELRALFLSKALEPPSPTATFMPKTPPSSPAIFHYSLPSPGLTSPLAMFDDSHLIAHQSYEPWVEQVDFRLPQPLQSKQIRQVNTPVLSKGINRVKSPPSLDQITARLAAHSPPCRPASPHRLERRLPAFLQSKQSSAQTLKPATVIYETSPRPSLSIEIGRLRMPMQRQTIASPQPVKACESSRLLPPQSPRSPLVPTLQVTTTVVPRTPNASPTELSETNLNLFVESRVQKSQNMLLTLRRRMAPSAHGLTGHEEEEERRKRRISAPADLPWQARVDFKHPVPSIPGGF